MPILSFLAHPQPGREDELVQTLDAMPECTVTPADNGPLLILVTETSSEEEDEVLRKRLKSIESLAFLSLVFAHVDPSSRASEEVAP